MNSQIISLVILGLSFLGMSFLILRKVPALRQIAQNTQEGFSENVFISFAKKIIAKVPGLKSFSPEIFLQKIVSRLRVISLKSDQKTAGWLKKLREKNQTKEPDGYWDNLKNSTQEDTQENTPR
jgi:hypothetical protein